MLKTKISKSIICISLIAWAGLLIRFVLAESTSYIYGWDVVREHLAIYSKFNFIKNFDFSKYSILDLPNAFRAPNLHWWLAEGPIISTTWQSLSPLYYITYAPFFILTGFNYMTSIYVTAVIGIMTLVLLYFFTKKYYGQRTSIIASTIYAFSFYNIEESLTGLNQGLVPIFTVLALISLYQIYENKVNYVYLMCIAYVGLLSYHASGFFLLPILSLLLIWKIKIFKFKHYFFGGLILIVGLFPYYLQEKMLMNKNTNIFYEYFIYGTSSLNKKVGMLQSMVYFWGTFSKTFSQFILPSIPFFIGIVLTTCLILFSLIKIVKRDNSKIFILLIFYLITFSLACRFDGFYFMGWWFYDTSMPLAIIAFSVFLNFIFDNIKKYSTVVPVLCVIIFLVFNIYAVYLDNFKASIIQRHNNAKYIAKIVAKDTNKNNFDLYFHTQMEGFNRINTHSPFKYLVAYNLTDKDLFLRSNLNPDEKYYKYLNVYTISDISNFETENFARDVYKNVSKEYIPIKETKLIYKNGKYSVYKSIFLNTKIQTDEQKK